jgi:regulatory protein
MPSRCLVRKPRKNPTPGDAYGKGLGLLARREHSTRELKAKLAVRGHADGEVRDAVDKLKDRRYQSDDRFAASLARSRAGQGYGPLRITLELKSHGLTAAAIREAIAATDCDWQASAAAQLRRRFGRADAADSSERARRAQFLLRRGFDPATVRLVTRAEVDDPGSEFD